MADKQTKIAGKGAPSGGPAAAGPAVPGALPEDVGRVYFRAGAALAFLGSLLLYIKTMAPTAPFWDAGEFIASSYILGIPHSPGTPLYVLVGRVFTLLPLPFSIAGRVNFISVLVGAGAVLFVYLLVVRFLDHTMGKSTSVGDTVVKVSGGLVGALFIAFSNTFWINSVEAEVYTVSVFIMGFMTWLALKWSDDPNGEKSRSQIYLLFYLLALTVGLHLGTILAFSGIFFLILMTKVKSFTNFEFLLAFAGMAIFVADATLYRNGDLTLGLLAVFALIVLYVYVQRKSVFALICTGLFVLGISVHLYLLIRSGHNPAIDEGNPETWRALYAVLRREQYPPTNIFIRKASFGFQLQYFNDYFQQQFQMASFYLGKLNIGSVIPLALGIWGIVDHYAKHRRTFVMLFVTFIVMSLGMIIYLNFSDQEVRERDYFYLPAFYYFAVFIGIGAGSLLQEIRRAFERRGARGLAPVWLPSIAFLVLPFFTASHHYYVHDRSGDIVCREYAKNMLVGLEENAIVFTNGDNDTFPLWYIQEVEKYRRDIRVVNLSLLNTPWYIEQLRDNDPPVNIQWTDQELARLTPIRTKDGIVLVRDIAVQHILKHESRNKPIYFAVTIPPNIYSPYRDFMEMEGLAYRVVPRKGTNMINLPVLLDNIWNKFSYDGILDENWKRDESVYQPPFVHRLIQNYGAAFTQAAFVQGRENNYCDAVKNLEVAKEISPNLEPVVEWLGWYKLECGDTLGALEYYDAEFAARPDRPNLLYRKAGVYERIGDMPMAIETLAELVKVDPSHRDAVISIVGMLMRTGQNAQAERYLQYWLTTHPNDQAVRKALDDLRAGRTPGGGSGE